MPVPLNPSPAPGPPSRTLTDSHSGEQAQRLKLLFLLGGPTYIILAAAELRLAWLGKISPPVLVLLLILNFGAIALIAWLILRSTGGAASALVRTVYAQGNLAPSPTFSAEESLIIRGKTGAAEELLRDRILARPAELESRMKLAELLEQMGRHDEAERIYLEVRRLQPSMRVEMTASNRLLNLYRKTGRHDRLKVELARFADRWKGTSAGDHAGRLLRELKDDTGGSSKNTLA
jgi:tetratricopeptide (TPR) repeat protein